MRVNHQGDVKLALELHASETAEMVADQSFVSPAIRWKLKLHQQGTTEVGLSTVSNTLFFSNT